LQVLRKLSKTDQFRATANAYSEILRDELTSLHPDYALLRRVLRNAGKYRIKNIIHYVISKFEDLVRLARDASLYISRVIDSKLALKHAEQFQRLICSAEGQLPHVNTWLAYVLSNPAFEQIRVPTKIDQIQGIRNQAPVAARLADRAWVKTYKNGLDTLGPWEKRAVMFASRILARDERRVWLGTIKAKGNFLENIVADHLLSEA
jgi:hypothetical protein